VLPDAKRSLIPVRRRRLFRVLIQCQVCVVTDTHYAWHPLSFSFLLPLYYSIVVPPRPLCYICRRLRVHSRRRRRRWSGGCWLGRKSLWRCRRRRRIVSAPDKGGFEWGMGCDFHRINLIPSSMPHGVTAATGSESLHNINFSPPSCQYGTVQSIPGGLKTFEDCYPQISCKWHLYSI
jgi:hypothetical protein